MRALPPGPDSTGLQGHDHPRFTGAVHRPEVYPVLQAESVGEGVIRVRLDVRIGSDLHVPVRIPKIQDQQAARWSKLQVLELLSGSVERETYGVVLCEKPQLRQLRPSIAT